jgi:hypothetical protein
MNAYGDIDPIAQMTEQEHTEQLEALRLLREAQEKPARLAYEQKSKTAIEKGELMYQQWLEAKRKAEEAKRQLQHDEDEEDEHKENEVLDPRLSLQEGDEVEEEVEQLGSNIENPDEWNDDDDEDVWG